MARAICVLFCSIYICLTAWCNESDCKSNNGIAQMIKKSINDVIAIEKTSKPWIGSKVKGPIDGKRIRIDSIYLMLDNIPQEIMSDKSLQINPFLRCAQIHDFPSDASAITIPGLILGADCSLRGNIFQINISEFVFGIEKRGVSPHSYALTSIANVLRSYLVTYELDCESKGWYRKTLLCCDTCHTEDNNMINLALHDSLIDFMCQIKDYISQLNRNSQEEVSISVIIDDVTVCGYGSFWYDLEEELEEKYNIYLTEHSQKTYEFIIDNNICCNYYETVFPKMKLNNNVLTIEMVYKRFPPRHEAIQTIASGVYEYTLDCDSNQWVQTQKTVNFIHL